MSVGKEIAHVERTLKALAPEVPTTDVLAAPEAARRTPDREPATVDHVPSPGETDEDGPDHHFPLPIAAGLVVLLATIVVAGMIVLEVGPFRAEPRVRATVPVVPVETAVTTAPSPTVVREPSRPTPGASNTLADEVAAARLALYYGDHEAAVDHLSAAALIDRDDTEVLEIARELVDRLVADAEGAVADAGWEDRPTPCGHGAIRHRRAR